MTPTNVVTSMPVSSSFRTSLTSKRVHGSQRLLEPEVKHFHADFPLIYGKLSWKAFCQVMSAILGLFGNTLTGDHMYSLHRLEKLQEQV